MKATVEFQWITIGEVRFDEQGKLEFPRLPSSPGAYALRFAGAGAPTKYIGETDNLQRRVSQYRTPGPSQLTNIRLNQGIHDHLGPDNS